MQLHVYYMSYLRHKFYINAIMCIKIHQGSSRDQYRNIKARTRILIDMYTAIIERMCHTISIE